MKKESEHKKVMKPPHKELIADGNRQKPPRAKSVPSTTSSEALTIMGDIDDEITTSASESYPQEESSSNEGNARDQMSLEKTKRKCFTCVVLCKSSLNLIRIFYGHSFKIFIFPLWYFVEEATRNSVAV